MTALVLVALFAALSIGDGTFAVIAGVLLGASGVMCALLWRRVDGYKRSLGGRLALLSLLVAIAGCLLPDPDGGVTLTPEPTKAQLVFFVVSVALAVISLWSGVKEEERQG